MERASCQENNLETVDSRVNSFLVVILLLHKFELFVPLWSDRALRAPYPTEPPHVHYFETCREKRLLSITFEFMTKGYERGMELIFFFYFLLFGGQSVWPVV